MDRTDIYKKYKKYKMAKPDKLLKQQNFLINYVEDNYDKIDKMLLYHGIGVGKTCSSIQIAETIMRINDKMKILVILPARLKTNYIDELIAKKCLNYKYITEKELKDFKNENSTMEEKDKIRKEFMKRINDNYEIVSYEYIRNKLSKSDDYKQTIDEITRNRVIIIDEFHNLLASKMDEYYIDTTLKSNKIGKDIIAINGLMMRLITKLANKSCKFFFLTATPVFDNYNQFIQLVYNLVPEIDKNRITDIKFLINSLKGKISYFKFSDLSLFPNVKINTINISLSDKQNKAILNLKNKNDNRKDNNTFCVKERQMSISLYNKTKKELVFSNLREYAPKLDKLFKLLKLPGKHVIYSSFIKYSLQLIAEYLEENGWSNYITNGSKNYKTYVIWDAQLNNNQKQEVKNVLNSYNNIDGRIIRVVLGSPSIKEGISFKHVQHFHQLDPVWNISAKDQLEGRVIRLGSHEQIKNNDKFLKKEVIIHNYIGKSDDYETCDDRIYNKIMVKKERIIKSIEKLLKKVAIDYYLWTNNKSPKSHSKSSVISVSSEKNKIFYKYK